MLITDWLQRSAEHHPERCALESLETGEQVSYAELDARASAWAAHLRYRHGLAAGARVAMLAQNRFAHLELLFACARAGLVFVPLNWRLAAPELAAILADSEPAVLLHDGEFAATATRLADDLSRAAGWDCVAIDLDPPNPPVTTSAAPAFGEPTSAGHTETFGPLTRLDDERWLLLYTSGTTGQPKGVIQTFGMALANALNTLLTDKVRPGDVFLNVLPFFHTGGLHLYTLPVLLSGGSVIIARRFDAARTLQRLADGVDALFAVPAIYLALAGEASFATRRFPRLRNLSVGGAPIPQTIAERFAVHGLVVAPSYGMTEAGPTLFAADLRTAAQKPLSVGKPVGSALIRLVDDSGQVLKGAARGRLQIAGPVVTPGYWNRPQATREAIVAGWLDSGDIAARDDDGDYFIVDRQKDMYISGGENVYPAEVENVLYALPEVAEAAVIGIADTRWGEVGLAVLVLRPGRQTTRASVQAACRAALAGYKVPQYVQLLDALPRTPSGKVEKHKLRLQFPGPDHVTPLL